LPGFGVYPKNLLFPFFAAVGGMKELAMLLQVKKHYTSCKERSSTWA